MGKYLTQNYRVGHNHVRRGHSLRPPSSKVRGGKREVTPGAPGSSGDGVSGDGFLGRKACRATRVPPPARDQDAYVPARYPTSGHSAIRSREEGARATQTTKAEELKQARTPHSPASDSPHSETPGKLTGSSRALARDGRDGESGPAELLVSGRTVRGCRFRPSNVVFCHFQLHVSAPEPWVTTFTKLCISCSRNTSTNTGPLVSVIVAEAGVKIMTA